MNPPSVQTDDASPGHGDKKGASSLVTLSLGAIGVVFGDIGTSPLYTFQECVGERGVAAARPENVLGVCSLIFWSLTFVVTIKYLLFLMKADNRGEGGIFALLALVPPKVRQGGRELGFVTLLVIAGAALLFGDGIITPAISVLSAFEGLQVATPVAKDIVVPLTCIVLLGLFAIQRRGTGRLGKLFGPVMVTWFVTIAALGLYQIVLDPAILWGVSPVYAVRFFADHGFRGFAMLGSVVLAITGGEALYADMGHFGRQPIRMAWLSLVFPALVLSYFGQGALLLRDPTRWQQPFFDLVPHGWPTYALVALAAPATIIASQALISGVFSLAHQGVQLGLFPRVAIKHTSSEAEGQIYVPALNWGLAVACIALVLVFKRSSALAAAYGLAVSGTMAITSIVFFVVIRKTWGWSMPRAVALLVLFLSFDLPFLGANLLKFTDGGYLPVIVGAGFFFVMVIWRRGKMLLAEHNSAISPPVSTYLQELESTGLKRIPGTAVFLTPLSDTVPPALLRQIRRLGVLQVRIVLLTVITEHTPHVLEADRVAAVALAQGFYRVVGHCGFMEHPDVPGMLARALEEAHLDIPIDDATYYLGRETFLATHRGRMGAWAEMIFAFLSRNAHSHAAYFQIPPAQVIELGVQIDL